MNRIIFAALLGACLSAPAEAGHMPGFGDLAGVVSGPAALGQLSVYAYNAEKRVGVMVYVVDGRYRATNLFPGRYEVTVRGTVGQLNWSLPQQRATVDVAADKTASADFAVMPQPLPPTYVGGMVYPDAKIVPYDKVYPPGRGRALLERICFGCHTVQLYPYNVDRTYATGRPIHDKDGWDITVDRMANGETFSQPGKASAFDAALLQPKDRAALVDYLAANFGEDAPARVVQQTDQPALDRSVLAKIQFVEYRFPNQSPDEARFTHTMDFDGAGNVWIMDRGAQSLVRIDPRTAAIEDHKGHGDSEFLAVDVDGTVWYSGLRHYDPKSDRHDEYRFEGGSAGRGIPLSTLLFDSNGDLWMSLLTMGGIAKYDRRTDKVSWWDVPHLRSRPYGITLDRDDKVWFAEYHNSGVARFDPKTETFRHYRIADEAPTNIRRVGIDSRNKVWVVTWGSRGMRNGALYRLDPEAGAVKQYKIGALISFANPYDAEVDGADNVWVATDNHILKFDPKTERFTLFPLPERTDVPKLAVTRDGAVWYGPRNAGQSGGYGGAAGVLYPDKDAIASYAAYYDPGNPRARKHAYRGPATPVTGVVKLQPAAPRNPGAYAAAVAGNSGNGP